jgi:hypothetical protein
MEVSADVLTYGPLSRSRRMFKGRKAWAFGLLVGINMVFGGLALIAMALHAREIDSRSAVPARYQFVAY